MHRGLATSRTQAQRIIADGQVTVAGVVATKAATLVAHDVSLSVRTHDHPGYASRAAHKLIGALDRLGVAVEGRHALDAGAAHGGFTDVLLRRGAARVVAADVAYGQLDWRLRSDDRVIVLERTNVRHLRPQDIPPPPPTLVVADLSFISLTLVLPALVAVTDPGADLVLMVKPQFEAGRDAVGRGGVVRDPTTWKAAVERVVDAGLALGYGLVGSCPSQLPGPAGNVEFFVHLRRDVGEPHPEAIADAVVEGLSLQARNDG